MKLRMFLVLALTIIISFALVTAQTKGDVAKKASDKKSDCSMTSMKSGGKDCCKKGEAASKDCCKKDGKMSENCSKGDKAKCDMSKDGKMSENCSHGDKAKCDMSKDGKKAGCDMAKAGAENCTHGDKTKCDMSKDGKKAGCDMAKAGSKDCCKDKAKATDTKDKESKTEKTHE